MTRYLKLGAALLIAALSSSALAWGGAVFTMSDDAAANAVLAYERDQKGGLSFVASVPTGGQGSGGGESVLGSQGAVTLSRDGRFLLVVDAGSDEVSVFRVKGAQVTLASRAPSGGFLPVSVTEHHGLVYVVNAGGAGNISGFWLGHGGDLHAIPGSTRPLSGDGVGPAQILFDPWGRTLAVTEKGSNAITLYRVGWFGLPSAPRTFPSAGVTPFGFEFTWRGVLVVSEAQGGAPNASTASSYDVRGNDLQVVSPAVGDGGTAACWLVVTNDGQYAFVGNAATHDLSSYRIDSRGALTLQEAVAGDVPDGLPLDLALSRWDRYLYALDAANHAIQAFAVKHGGELEAMGPVATDLPPSAVGLAAR
jgi:6-phosphogluconolactonase